MTDDSNEKLDSFVNPEMLRSNMINASLFIAAFEMLKSSIVDQVRFFFVNRWIADDPSGIAEYEEHVLSLDKNRNPLDASLEFFRSMSAIDDADIEVFRRARAMRNKLVHEFPGMRDFSKPIDIFGLFTDMHSLLIKIDTWWIRNVEATLIPDFDPDDENTSFLSGPMVMLSKMIDIVYGKE
ncbi:hypothetical protein J7K50_06295 [bacterium]|nr:hypothetical protein [bacterium]